MTLTHGFANAQGDIVVKGRESELVATVRYHTESDIKINTCGGSFAQDKHSAKAQSVVKSHLRS